MAYFRVASIQSQMTVITDTAVNCMMQHSQARPGVGEGREAGTNYRGPGCPGPDSVAYILLFISIIRYKQIVICRHVRPGAILNMMPSAFFMYCYPFQSALAAGGFHKMFFTGTRTRSRRPSACNIALGFMTATKKQSMAMCCLAATRWSAFPCYVKCIYSLHGYNVLLFKLRRSSEPLVCWRDFVSNTLKTGAWGGVVVKELRYQSDGPGIDSQWCHWIFQ